MSEQNKDAERAAFEFAANQKFYGGLAAVGDTWSEDRGMYVDPAHHMAWWAWQQRASLPVGVPDGGEDWSVFIGYLIDKCEGHEIAEERLQGWLSEMLADPHYGAMFRREKQPCDMPSAVELAIEAAEEEHGSLRAAAKAIGVDAGYLSRLKNGEKVNPGDDVLAALGLEKVVTYRAAAAPTVKAEQVDERDVLLAEARMVINAVLSDCDLEAELSWMCERASKGRRIYVDDRALSYAQAPSLPAAGSAVEEVTPAMIQAACAAFRMDVSPMQAMQAALRAALSAAGCRCVRFGEGNPHWPCRIHAGPAQGEREAPVVVATAILGGLFHGGSGPELGEIDIEVCTPALEELQCETVNSSDDVFLPLMTVAQHERIVDAISVKPAALAHGIGIPSVAEFGEWVDLNSPDPATRGMLLALFKWTLDRVCALNANRAALSAQQSALERVSVPVELLERVTTWREGDEGDSGRSELRALLASYAEGGKV